MNKKELYEARRSRDAERLEPGTRKKALAAEIAAGRNPSKAASKRATDAVIERAKRRWEWSAT